MVMTFNIDTGEVLLSGFLDDHDTHHAIAALLHGDPSVRFTWRKVCFFTVMWKQSTAQCVGLMEGSSGMHLNNVN